MWIDFERRFGVLAGSFFGRQVWLFGADGEGDVAATGPSRLDRRRRVLAVLRATGRVR